MEENKGPSPSKGYQKQIKKEDNKVQRKPSANVRVDYSSPTAKKWPLLLEAIQNGDLEAVKKLIEEGVNVNLIREGVTPLMLASSKGHTEIAGIILQAGANINEKSDDGWTALHKAVFDQGKTAIVDLLMQSGIDVEAKNISGKTALNLAEEKGHREIARVIKKHQVKLRIDAQEWEAFLNSSEGKPFKRKKLYERLILYSKFLWVPPLAIGGCGLLLGYLLDVAIQSTFIGILTGLFVDVFYYYQKTSIRKYLDNIGPLPDLDIHTLRSKRKAGEPLLDGGTSKPISDKEPAIVPTVDAVPVPAGNPSMEEEPDSTLELESNNVATPAFRFIGTRTVVTLAIAVLVIAVLFGLVFVYREPLFKLYFSKKLEQRGIPFTEQAFLAEVSKNNEEAVDLFIKAGINQNSANENGQTALIVASEKGLLNIIEELVKLRGTSLNQFDKNGNTALMMATRRGHEQAAKLLVEGGADVNFTIQSADGAATALQAAVDTSDFTEENLSILQYLIQKGADVKGRNAAGRFPLLFATDHGHIEAAKMLIEHGADVNAADQSGNFPLLLAACNGYPWMVTLLVEKGANIGMALPDGNTSLMCAARKGNIDIVKVLLEKSVNINTKNSYGSTALTEATARGYVDIVKLLLGRGADPSTASLPVSFVTLSGKRIAISAKNEKTADILRRIAKMASQDGYAIKAESIADRKSTISLKAPWNKVLIDFARKNHLLLVVKDKEIFVIPYRT
ncbi:MAG TPA: ankyrin repeat domain-containing protein [Nitrospirota bacterium]|nr:ankyrin repeat domain-containing protein [Nitrospirota bacterium]